MAEEFLGTKKYIAGTKQKIGILLLNLGTPDAPKEAELRTYLREFLSDRRVIEVPKLIWTFILHGIILRTRPKKSAEAYATVWSEEGSPLYVISKKQKAKLQAQLNDLSDDTYHVALGMRYGNPSVKSALLELKEANCQKMVILPLYPQYSAATTASTFDAVVKELTTWRWVPELRFINNYYEEPSYIQAMANSIQEHWDQHGKSQKLLFSLHGMPLSYFEKGDPYFGHCHKSTRLIAEKLGLKKDEWELSFQSLFGKEEWLKPYTDGRMHALPDEGVKSLDVVCPGFSADCLETIEEIGEENREYFEESGGDTFHYIPCLNDREDHIDMMTELVKKHTQGWALPDDEEREKSRQAAMAYWSDKTEPAELIKAHKA